MEENDYSPLRPDIIIQKITQDCLAWHKEAQDEDFFQEEAETISPLLDLAEGLLKDAEEQLQSLHPEKRQLFCNQVQQDLEDTVQTILKKSEETLILRCSLNLLCRYQQLFSYRLSMIQPFALYDEAIEA